MVEQEGKFSHTHRIDILTFAIHTIASFKVVLIICQCLIVALVLSRLFLPPADICKRCPHPGANVHHSEIGGQAEVWI